jgi:hypothetical protein
VYAVNGDHIGWFEISTLYDVHNRIVGMLQHTCAPLSAERLPPPMPEFRAARTYRGSRCGIAAHRSPCRLPRSCTPVRMRACRCGTPAAKNGGPGRRAAPLSGRQQNATYGTLRHTNLHQGCA